MVRFVSCQGKLYVETRRLWTLAFLSKNGVGRVREDIIAERCFATSREEFLSRRNAKQRDQPFTDIRSLGTSDDAM